MPVFLDRGSLGYRHFAATEESRGKQQPDFRENDANCIDLGLVNNMPDSALEQTERQILTLLDAVAGDIVVRLRLYALPDVQREEWGRKHLSRLNYYSSEDLWNSRIDGLIVTGAEPRAPDLVLEPYWNTLAKVFDWAEHNTSSTVLSCLAVHAAVQHLDGIGRHSLADKCFGVFEFERSSGHQMIGGLPSRLQMPHSRWNEIREDALTSCGYEILVRGPDAGVDTFVKSRKSLFVFFQGHPEYDAWTLMAEYRRDIERFLKGEREAYPSMPRGYFDEASARALNALRDRALVDRRKELVGTFPTDLLVGKLKHSWRPAATQMYSNWLRYMSARKAERSRPGFPSVTGTAARTRHHV